VKLGEQCTVEYGKPRPKNQYSPVTTLPILIRRGGGMRWSLIPVIVGIHATKRRTANIIKVLPFEVIAAKHWP